MLGPATAVYVALLCTVLFVLLFGESTAFEGTIVSWCHYWITTGIFEGPLYVIGCESGVSMPGFRDLHQLRAFIRYSPCICCCPLLVDLPVDTCRKMIDCCIGNTRFQCIGYGCSLAMAEPQPNCKLAQEVCLGPIPA